MSELGRVLNEVNDPPVKALFVYNSNPAAVCPNHNAVVRGMLRPDLFMVVHDQFLTDTCDYADIVLPATTFFEHADLQAAYGHYFLQVSDAAIEPLGVARSNVETFRALALRMGFRNECFHDTVNEMMDAALANGHPWLEGITRERLQKEGQIRLKFGLGNADVGFGETPQQSGKEIQDPKSPIPSSFFLPFSEGGFFTSSGKAELYSEPLAQQGLDPVAAFVPPLESRHQLGRTETSGDLAKYPLELLPRKCDNFVNSTFANLPGHQQMEDPGLLEISGDDARARRIADRDWVRVFNDRGEIRLRAHVDGAVHAGVVAARLGWAKLSADGGNINVLTSERLTDIGRGATFFSTLVQVEKI